MGLRKADIHSGDVSQCIDSPLERVLLNYLGLEIVLFVVPEGLRARIDLTAELAKLSDLGLFLGCWLHAN